MAYGVQNNRSLPMGQMSFDALEAYPVFSMLTSLSHARLVFYNMPHSFNTRWEVMVGVGDCIKQLERIYRIWGHPLESALLYKCCAYLENVSTFPQVGNLYLNEVHALYLLS